MIKSNARFRGPTELNKYSNALLEAVHDMKVLGSVMDRNEFFEGHRGHTDYIEDNFSAYMNGGTPITSEQPTATVLNHPKEDAMEPIDLMASKWVPYGGVQKTKGDLGVILQTEGLLDPAGLRTQYYAEEGDILYIRLGVRLISGNGSAFAVGSENINQGESDIQKFKIPGNGSTIFLDKRLYCKHREPITLNIDVHRLPDTLSATAIEITHIEIRKMTENAFSVEPINTVIKSKVRNIEDRIQNIIQSI